MINIISYIFKLLFSAILGGSMTYSPSIAHQDTSVIKTAILCVISAAIFGGIILTPDHLQSGLAFGSLVMLSAIVYKVDVPIIKAVAAIVAGMLTGLGFPIFGILFTILMIFLNRYTLR